MKKIFVTLFTVLASITFVFAQEQASEKMYLYLNDGSILAWDVTKIDSLNFEQPAVQSITLSDEAVTLYAIGQQHTLTATVAPSVWEGTITYTSANPEVATVVNGVITAVAVGKTTITAQAEDKTATCTVDVQTTKVPEGSEFYPIIMDAVTFEALGNKVISDFRPDGMTKNLWIWENTYTSAVASGLNYFGNAEGYTALTVGTMGWSGLGFCAQNVVDGSTSDFGTQVNVLIDKMLASPEDYFLHIAIKSTDNASHTFYFGCTDATKFVLGTTVFDGGVIFSDFPRDGSWTGFDIPMTQFVNGLTASARDGANLFVALSGGTAGVQLNLDAVYFYKK